MGPASLVGLIYFLLIAKVQSKLLSLQSFIENGKSYFL